MKLLFALLLVFTSTPALARSSYGGYGSGTYETSHLMSAAAGIASPSATTSLFENPAGLVYNEDFKLGLAGASSNNQFNPIGASGTLYLGNGLVGGAIGAQTFSAYQNNAGTVGLVNYGLAVDIRPLGFALGVAGSYLVQTLGAGAGVNPAAPWGLNVGIIGNPTGEVRGGITAFDVLGGVSALGAGLAWDPNGFATLAVDATTNLQFQGTTVIPGISIHVSAVQLKAAYGFGVDNFAGSYARRGGTLGLGIQMSPYFHWQFYYNELALYYASLVFQLSIF